MNEHYPFVNPPLPYTYDALEPYIDTKTMHLHHDRHLQTYVDNLNNTLKSHPEIHDWSLDKLLINAHSQGDNDFWKSIRNNGGGVYNHIFYFNVMSDLESRFYAGDLYYGIIDNFESIENFYNKFMEKALSVFGSGYAWLVVNQKGELEIVTTANQDTPIVEGLNPIFTIDVWEHAYYLLHYNDRKSYINSWFNVLDWERADDLYRKSIQNIK